MTAFDDFPRRAARRVCASAPAPLRNAIILELAARSLIRARNRCRSVADVTELTRSWRGYGDLGHIAALQHAKEQTDFFELVRDTNPRIGLEIGTANGGTLFQLLAVGSRELHAISVDLEGGPDGGGYSKLRAKLFHRAFPSSGQRLDLVSGDSTDPVTIDAVRSLLGAAALDYLFIDGDHRYSVVKSDFLSYAPLVRKGGLIALHDITRRLSRSHDDVWRLWEELSGSAASREFRATPTSPGIGVLYPWDPAAFESAK